MRNEFEPTVPQQLAFADHLVDAVVLDATGETDGDRCVGEPPSAKYFLGTLAPRRSQSGGGQGAQRTGDTKLGGLRNSRSSTTMPFSKSAPASVAITGRSPHWRSNSHTGEPKTIPPTGSVVSTGSHPSITGWMSTADHSPCDWIPTIIFNTWAQDEFANGFTASTDDGVGGS